MKLHRNKRNLKTTLNPIDHRPVIHDWSRWWKSVGNVYVSFAIYIFCEGSRCKKNNIKKSAGHVIQSYVDLP